MNAWCIMCVSTYHMCTINALIITQPKTVYLSHPSPTWSHASSRHFSGERGVVAACAVTNLKPGAVPAPPGPIFSAFPSGDLRGCCPRCHRPGWTVELGCSFMATRGVPKDYLSWWRWTGTLFTMPDKGMPFNCDITYTIVGIERWLTTECRSRSTNYNQKWYTWNGEKLNSIYKIPTNTVFFAISAMSVNW